MRPPTDNQPLKSSSRRRSRRSQSPEERVARYRYFAFLGNFFGLGGIFLGFVMVIFRNSVFLNHDLEIFLGVVLFTLGYVGVITGCSYWIKAKEWPATLLAIGLLPLLILCVPFVRLIFVVQPFALPLGVIMMSMIQIVVVWVLPDKSGISQRSHERKRW